MRRDASDTPIDSFQRDGGRWWCMWVMDSQSTGINLIIKRKRAADGVTCSGEHPKIDDDSKSTENQKACEENEIGAVQLQEVSYGNSE